MRKNITSFAGIGTVALVILYGLSMPVHAEKLTEVDALQATKPVGSAFTRALTNEYRAYSTQERDNEQDYPDAIHFARKGLAAANGHRVMPEPIKDWDIKNTHMRKLASARARLMTAFQKGGRSTAPDLAANAQMRFDCWLEQREENWASQAQIPCRQEFEDAINLLENRLPADVPVPKTAAMPPVKADTSQPDDTQAAIEQAVFLTFFDFDKENIGSGGTDVLDSLANEIKKRNDISTVKIVGHTDTSGPESYNMKLSRRRAEAVREALVKRGISKDMVTIDNKGQTDLLVSTPDNVREPANRRARISFE